MKLNYNFHTTKLLFCSFSIIRSGIVKAIDTIMF